MRALLVVMALLLAGCAQTMDEPKPVEATAPLSDPLAAGTMQTTSQTWSNSVTVVMGDDDAVPRGAYPIELRGTIHVPEAGDAHPVLVFMHGRHVTCRYADTTEFLAPGVCPEASPALEPVWSERGYEYLAESLAAHGFVVVSVNANNVNDFDLAFSLAGDDSGATARAHIIGRVLRDLMAANRGTPIGDWPDLTDRLDPARFGLMGHSRGGEGVVAAHALIHDGTLDSGGAVLRGVFALAPTDFKHWSIRDVPFATIIPYCDGDVTNLQGSWMYDDNRGLAPLHQFITMGANHNFYNTVWTGDDFGSRTDPWCSPDAPDSGRNTPESQREQGAMLMSTFFRAYVGEEPGLMPYLTGEEAWPIATPTSFHAPGAKDCLTDQHNLQTCDLTSDVFRGPLSIASCFARECPATNSLGTATQQVLSWQGDATWSVPTRAAGHVVTMRFAIGRDSDAAEQVTIRAGSQAWTLAELGAAAAPGDDHAKTLLTMVRVPVPDGAKTLELEFRGTGQVQTADWLRYSSK